MTNNFFYTAVFTIIFAGFIGFSSCKEPPLVKKPFNEAEDLKPGAPASEFTVKIDAPNGTMIAGYIKTFGKGTIDSIVADGNAQIQVKTTKSNRVTCYVQSLTANATLLVSIFSEGKLLLRDSSNAVKSFVQLTAYPDTAGKVKTHVQDSIAYYLNITCDEASMNAVARIRKNKWQNFSTYKLEGKTPLLIPITDCRIFEAEVYNDESLMEAFVCEIWDSKKNPIARKMCEYGGPGVAIHLYDDEYFKKSKKDSTETKSKK